MSGGPSTDSGFLMAGQALPSLAIVLDQGPVARGQADNNTQALFAKEAWFKLFSAGHSSWKAVGRACLGLTVEPF